MISPVTQCNLNCIHCISRRSRQAGAAVMEDAVWAQIAAGAQAGHLEHVRSDYSGDLLNSDKRHGGWLDRVIALDIPFEIDTHANDLTEEAAAKLIGSRLRTINFSLDTMDPEDYPSNPPRGAAARRGHRQHPALHGAAPRAPRPTSRRMLSVRADAPEPRLSRRGARPGDKTLGISYVAGNHLHVYTPDMAEESLLLAPHRYAAACERLHARARAMGVTLTLPEPGFATAPGRGHVPCSVARHTALVLGNGDVMVCCMPGTKVGNLSQDSLAGIWHGAADANPSGPASTATIRPSPAPSVRCAGTRPTARASFPASTKRRGAIFQARCLDAARAGAWRFAKREDGADGQSRRSPGSRRPQRKPKSPVQDSS